MGSEFLKVESSDQLSADYQLQDLCVTNQALSAPNLPSEQSLLDNGRILASVLEQISAVIGPFKILSGFRTAELEAKLTAQGEPTAKGLSFHQLFRAADIYPLTVSLDEMFGRIMANSSILESLVELAWKPSQNSIHLAINTPDDTRDTKVLGLDENKNYVRLSMSQIEDFIQPYLSIPGEAFSQAALLVGKQNKLPIFAAMGALAAGTFWFLTRKKSKTA